MTDLNERFPLDAPARPEYEHVWNLATSYAKAFSAGNNPTREQLEALCERIHGLFIPQADRDDWAIPLAGGFTALEMSMESQPEAHRAMVRHVFRWFAMTYKDDIPDLSEHLHSSV